MVLISIAHILRKALSTSATAKKLAQNENTKTKKKKKKTTEARKKYPFQLPQFSVREPRAGL